MGKDTKKPLDTEALATAPSVSEPVITDSAPLAPSGIEAEETPIPPGHVLLAALDKDGNETSTFTVSEKGWKRTYSDETKFRFKKKAS
ncbi:MAG: hypothetical protein EOP52_13465 [Sphingobacteriales bacterium]|nr:MAG: hypothetical protein EOP52_13465 [Sphingobacteriales bacterium]